ncbi:MAG: hypothetical protein IIA87_02685 [Nanoarchaeota archaeon]|nr:hypothetical protein [Nanoarchaeota archaeon]
MENYKRINPGQSYDTIGREIGGQLKSSPTHDIRFVRVPDTKLMYVTHVLESNDVPTLDEFDFIGASDVDGLGALITDELERDRLPEEIRAVSPKSGQGGWGLFFKD